MALGSFASSFTFSAAGHIHTFLPDRITVGALTGIASTTALGTATGKLQVNANAFADPFAFGTETAKLQVNGTGLADGFVFGTEVIKLQVNGSGFAETDAVGNALVVAKDWSVVVAPTSTDMSVVTAATGTAFTEVSNEGSL